MQVRSALGFGAIVVSLVLLAAGDASAQEEPAPQPNR
jgi:hypothetical protein